MLEICNKYKDIYIYGDGEVGRLVRIYLAEQGVSVKGFIVTRKPNNKVVLELPVYSFFDVEFDIKETFIFICMNKKWKNEVINTIKNIGIGNFLFIDNKLETSIRQNTQFINTYKDEDKKLCILMYHRIENILDPLPMMVSEYCFEEQLKFIKSNYKTVRCDEDWSNINQKTIALTFDDGYVDFYSKAYPLLKKYNIPATVFVTTGNIGNDKEFWWDELSNIIVNYELPQYIDICGKQYYLSEYDSKKDLLFELRNEVILLNCVQRDKEILELKKQVGANYTFRKQYRTMNESELEQLAKDPLITIGAHTVSHILCDCEKDEVQFGEIYDSKQKLEEIINRDVDLFAYPNGNVGKNTRNILDEIGFKRAFTCVHACMGDYKKFDIPRCPIFEWQKNQIDNSFKGIWQTSKLFTE